jgi:hypothetical protein
MVGAFLSIAVATGCKESSWTPLGSAELILSEVKLRGAPAVSRRLDSDENFGRSVTNGIATGDTVWLEVADKIVPASAAAEASLSIALASALLHSPTEVLSLLGSKYPVEEVCGMPFLKADSGAVISYYDSAAVSLGKVTSAPLVGRRDSCRTALNDARDRRLERINPGYLIKNKPVSTGRRRR